VKPIHFCAVQKGPIDGVHAVHMDSARAFDKHWHDYFGFGLMDRGGQVSASGRGQVQALAGQIITTNPGEVHDGVPLQKHARRWRMVYMRPDVLAEMVGRESVELTRPVLDDPLLHHVFDTLFRHWAPMPAAGVNAMQEESLTHAVGLLVRHYGCEPPADERRVSMAAIRECLLDQLHAPPTLAALAANAGLSRYQLVRQFSKAHGLPPFAWLQQHRLRRAQALIVKGLPLSDAALNSGFSDQSHLTRAFTRYLGFTPGAWQRAHRPGAQ
jgi:AraC-like DNA-binding protein